MFQAVPGTALRVGGEARPMTSVAGAGYQSNRQGTFDPLNQNHGPAPALAERADNGPEDLAKEMERQVLSPVNRKIARGTGRFLVINRGHLSISTTRSEPGPALQVYAGRVLLLVVLRVLLILVNQFPDTHNDGG